MKREELEHVVRVAATLAEDDEIVVIGSQAILGQFPHAPEELVVSNEVDLWPLNHPERADLIDGAIGELSQFHETFGYYAQGVSESTAVLPDGWKSRLVPVRTPATRGAVALCLEVHDLLVSKYVGNREKDRIFARAAIKHGLASEETLLLHLQSTPVSAERARMIADAIRSDFKSA